MTRDPLKVIFVCWGNICRSPMGERIAQQRFTEAGLDVIVTSAGVSAEERGNPIDRRAQRVLAQHGFSTGGHRAHQITGSEISAADLVLAFEQIHLDKMRRLAPGASNLFLVTDFDPAAPDGSGIDDPWYGGAEDFDETRQAIEAALPGVVTRLRELAN